MLRALAFLVPLLLACPLFAGNHCNVQVQALQSGLAVVPFAIPVGVPIATVQANPMVYGFSSAGTSGYSAQSTVKAQSAEDALVERLAAKIAARLGIDPASIKAAAVPEAPTLLSTNCLKCHGPDKQSGGVRFDVPISDELRLRSITAMMQDDPAKRMPKGKTLDAATLGRMIQELSARPKGPTAAVLPEAVPEPPKP